MSSYDAIVVGAGIGGLYAIERLRRDGLSVLGLEKASGVGGVWFHNRYPGARVDIESTDYCYHFSGELYRDWIWSERFAGQKELLAYLNHVADRFDIRRHIRFDTALESARWEPDEARYRVETSDGQKLDCRFLVMATGNLSAARAPAFPGLNHFGGEWLQTSHWPDREVAITRRRVAVIGTGSSGVQAIPEIARTAGHLTVFQRTANFSVPARNAPLDPTVIERLGRDVAGRRASLIDSRAGSDMSLPGSILLFASYSPAERIDRLKQQWAHGGQGMNRVFADQGTDQSVNHVVSDFVRNKIRETVSEPRIAELLCPHDHPLGTRRLSMDSGYYETFNRDNVALVDVASDPIERITETGIRLASGAHHEVDLIVFALGFDAFGGAISRIDIRNAAGAHPTDAWHRGPRTMLGLMTAGFPNFFLPTGPGSPSVLANMTIMNEQHIDFMAGLIAHMKAKGHDSVEPEPEAEDRWTAEVATAAGKLLRLGVKNYMVHVNEDDGSRVFIPYVGGLDRFDAACRASAENGYSGFRFGRAQRHEPALDAEALA